MANQHASQRVINGVDTMALRKTLDDLQKNPKLARCEFRVHNHWMKGDENLSETKNFYAANAEQKHKKTFQVQAGEPTLLAGHDNAANPAEHLLSSLAGCITTTIAYYAALNGYKIKQMDSDYEGDLDLQGIFNLDSNVRPGYQKIRVHFKIQTNAPKEELEKYWLS